MQLNRLYIFNSRILTHLLFWVFYYVSFSLIWSLNGSYFKSFYLEFILLPTRILAVYATIYFLLPKFLLNRKYLKFVLGYALLVCVAAVLQHVFMYWFYDGLLLGNTNAELFNFKMLVRAAVLINTTVFLVLVVKIFQLYLLEREKNYESENIIEIKADRRIHRVRPQDILFIEGKGNYTTYQLVNDKKITAYGSIKKALELLPKNFVRVHKSYVVNKHEIKSLDQNTIEIRNHFIPRGKSVTDELLFG